jgi:Na+/H+ antiporter NhaB
MILIALLIVLVWLSISLNLYVIYLQVKKGNKDQQEIKTRLHWIKQRQKNEKTK